MKKRYMITCSTDPYSSSRTAKHHGKKILEMTGGTPIARQITIDYLCIDEGLPPCF